MATYRTLTYLDAYRPSASAMSSAPTLNFNRASQTFLQLGYENVAEFYESGSYASLRDLFKVNLTEGNKYFIYSSSFFDPFILSLHDVNGAFLATDSGTSYGSDVIYYTAPYTGSYYVDASWDQGSASRNKFVSLSVYEDVVIKTAPTPAPVVPTPAPVAPTPAPVVPTPAPVLPIVNSTPKSDTHSISLIVEKGVLGVDAVILSNLVENITTKDGLTTSHTIKLGNTDFAYSQIDSLIMTVTRDGNFTDEFRREISDAIPSASGLTYKDVVSIVGTPNIDSVILKIAGLDGLFVA